jgi:opacity protein-like surface antigen
MCYRLKLIYLAVHFFSLMNIADAQLVSKVGTTSAKFLTIPVGARATALGGAFTSISNDATAMYWNPSGIATLSSLEVTMSHTTWLADIVVNFGGVVVPLGSVWGAMGIHVTAMTMGEMEITTEEEPEGTGGTFRAGSYAIGISYARNLTDWFSIGGTVKYINETIWNSSASGFAVDLGTLLKTPIPDVRFGVSVSNFGEKLQMSGADLLVQKDIDEQKYGNNPAINAYLATDRFDLPLTLRTGLSADVIKRESHLLTLAVDAAYPNDNVEFIDLGLEYSFFDRQFSVRGGYRSLGNEEAEQRWSMGAGVQHTLLPGLTLRVDYAFQTFGRLRNIQKLDLSLQF